METSSQYETKLLKKVASGDGRAFTELVDKYGALVFHYIRQHSRNQQIAEEIVQDIFTQVWLARHTLPEVRNFKTFLYVVSRNYAINVLKKLIREQERQALWQNQPHETSNNNTEDVEDWRIGLIQRAVNQLPPQQQKVWILSRREGFKHAEIAEQMGLSKDSVKKYLQWANAAIIKYVQERMPIIVALLLCDKF